MCNPDVTDADIEAMDVAVWVDLKPARTLTANFSQCSAVGDLPKYLYSRAPSNAGLIFAGNWDFELYQLNSNAIGLSRDSDPSAGHGQHLTDSSLPVANWDEEFQVHHIFKAPASYNDTFGLFKLGNNQCRVQSNTNGGMKFVSSTGTVVLTNIAWTPSRTYILSIQRKFNVTSSSYEVLWRWEDLDGDTTVTETTDAGEAVADGANWSIGVSGVYFRHIAGPLVGVQGLDATEYDNCISWLRLWHAGTSTSESESSTTTQDASFFLELEIKT